MAAASFQLRLRSMCIFKYFTLIVCFSSSPSRKICTKSREIAIEFLVPINMTSPFLWLLISPFCLVSDIGKVFIYVYRAFGFVNIRRAGMKFGISSAYRNTSVFRQALHILFTCMRNKEGLRIDSSGTP